ncbi:MAG: FixH family protein [Halioglobus sp.]|nr:FixH family protein [Halioglobus sp.]
MLPASVVVAGLSTLYIANRHADDLVADDYYKEGLAINRRIERTQNAADLGISANFSVSERIVTVSASGPVHSDTLRLHLSHPLEADRDLTVTLNRAGPGTYMVGIPVELGPRWHWALEDAAGNWRLNGALERDDFDNGHGN